MIKFKFYARLILLHKSNPLDCEGYHNHITEDKKLSDTTNGIAVIVIVIVFVFLIGGRGMLVDKQVAINTMEAQGFTDVKITDKAWFLVEFRGCGSDDTVRFEVTATNPNGQRVDCLVCADWPFKGATIRYR
ncbi:MAG: hypothetical protein U9P70_04675 [Patescibacteria group bacterium]|nr:hypothetical protein [Patescibacteria group bacterium]